ncbi:hypothetical protein CQW23_32357 [Capsicum baccatum]|uniref:Uncharacterized protein n=1 Tax=Capsicum baccatum TaxID=33114 RepID=A0A2G2V510_CAPBA|nr:hypothetical protein CQW23_32357 [Capsicum baccatum]
MGLSPSLAPPSRGLGPGPPLTTAFQTTIRTTEPPDSKAGLFPIRSPLLRESFKYHISLCYSSMRAEISIAESHFRLQKKHRSPRRMPQTGHEGQAIDSSIPWRFPHRGSLVACRARWARTSGMGGGARARYRRTQPMRTPQLLNTFAESFCGAGFDKDPSAGSPTETLLRLLRPLNNKVQWTYLDVVGSEPPTSPQSEHFTGSFNR